MELSERLAKLYYRVIRISSNSRSVFRAIFFLGSMLILLARFSFGDSVKPLTFGPFFVNGLSSRISPTGFNQVLSDITYHFQLGWIEPLATKSKGVFEETYFETDGNFNASPFTTDIGTAFYLKPIRYLELGLSYNRLLFNNSMVTFGSTESSANGGGVPLHEWQPSQVIAREYKELGGADIFTYQINGTFNIGPLQLYINGTRTLWDIDAKAKNYVFEYGTDILLKPRDRVNALLTQITFDLRPYSLFKTVSFTGLALRSQYWYAAQTRFEKNLISGGITGFRLGQNPERQRRGLDFSIGYWTMNPQLDDSDWKQNIMLLADWKWNIQFLKI